MAASVVTPTSGVDPRVALATSIHAAPGVYAVLVGSGMSTAAGIKTGWQVVQDLIRKVATAEGVDAGELGDRPEVWWAQQKRPEPRCDTLLGELATTDAARQALLRAYFDPPPGAGGPILPTAGHEALASLCLGGRVRLILTTNFDRLIEHALDAVGISAQVISSPKAVAGMIPLQHAPVTVLKLHGDYAMPGLRNTPEELRRYPPKWRELLKGIFDEYGLLVIGWSAEYDVALAEAIRNSPSRRYPMFWTTFQGSTTHSARRLIATRQAAVIDTTGADELLTDLVERLRRLDEIAVRRTRPFALRTYSFPPEQHSAPQGWAVLPLLQLRSAATVGPGSLDEYGLLRAEQRDALLDALRVALVTTRLRYLTAMDAASAAVEPPAPGTKIEAPGLFDWSATPGVFQTGDYASYRMGGDASAGISSLVTVRLPRAGVLVSSLVLTIDMGLSLKSPIRLGEAALLFRDALMLVTVGLSQAIAGVVPEGADIRQCEIHAAAANSDGINRNRPNDLLLRIDMSSLGSPARPANSPVLQMGFAARVSGALSERDFTELVAQAIETMAIDNGFLDTRLGIGALRRELGLQT